MAEDKLEIAIRAKTDEFVKSLDDIKKRTSNLSKQMQEIDKQLKTENVDHVAKLSEKLELVKRSANLAAKEAEEYAKSIKAVSENHKEGEELTEKQQKKIEDLSEKMALAQQKANTYALEIDKLSKELAESADASNKAETETNETADSFKEAGAEAESAAPKIDSFWKSLGTNLLTTAITTGIQKTINLFKELANAAWNAAKKIASTAWDWAQSGADLIETQNKVSAVFGESDEAMQDWASNAAHNLRTTKQAAMESAASYGNILTNMGAARNEAAKYSMRLVEVAAAQADFNNMSTEEVLQKIQSALAGNYQGLKALGIVMSSADVTEKALSMTHKQNKDELTELEKEYAAIELIMEYSANAEEKYAENSGSLVSLTAELKSRFADLRDEIGARTTPVFENLFQKIADYISSDEGQNFLNSIVEKVGELSDKLIDFINSGDFVGFLENTEKQLPVIWEDVCQLAEALGTVVDFILQLKNPTRNYDDLKELDEAVKSSKTEVHAFAESAGIDMAELRLAIQGFANLNNTSLTEIYGDWATYEPQIQTYMEATGSAATTMKDNVTTATGTMASQVKTDADAMADALQDGINKAGNISTSALESKTAEVESLGSRIAHALGNFVSNSGLFQNAPGRASGGPVYPGQMYQVNDDSGRRKEMFIPSVPGYILNGNQTQSIVNNTSSNQTYGDVNVYVNSYGADAASIAAEIGQEVNKKLRLSGAW